MGRCRTKGWHKWRCRNYFDSEGILQYGLTCTKCGRLKRHASWTDINTLDLQAFLVQNLLPSSEYGLAKQLQHLRLTDKVYLDLKSD